MFDVVVVGSLNLDLVATADRLPGPGETVGGDRYDEFAGGKGLNQAVAAARAGARVAMLGCVGDDDAGERLRSIVRDEGIDDRRLTTIPDTPTGRALITVDRDAENSIVVVPGANGHVAVDPEALPPAHVLLTQFEVPLAAVTTAVRAARAAGAVTILNPAPAHVEVSDDLLAASSVVVPNQHEVELLGGAETIIERGADTVVVTRGGDGVDVVDAGGTTHHDAFAVTALDTTGAGDAFCGALAARLAAGDDPADAVRFATAAGALATTASGAVPSLPHADAVRRLLDGSPTH